MNKEDLIKKIKAQAQQDYKKMFIAEFEARSPEEQQLIKEGFKLIKEGALNEEQLGKLRNKINIERPKTNFFKQPLKQDLEKKEKLLLPAYKLPLEDKGRYDNVPSGPLIQDINRALAYAGTNRDPKAPGDLDIKVTKDLNGVSSIIFNSKNQGITLKLPDFHSIAQKKDRTNKIFSFILMQSNKQNNAPEITFHLSELVEREIYKSIKSARKGIKKIADKLTSMKISGTVKTGNKEISSTLQVLFTGMDIKKGNCIISRNSKIPIEFITQFYTLLPLWSYALSDRAFAATEYIYARARQNLKNIKEKEGSFNIKLETLAMAIGLPTPEETHRHTDRIKTPILDIIDEIEDYQIAHEIKHIQLTPHYKEEDKISDFLKKGYLEIKLTGEIIEYFETLLKRNTKRVKSNKKLS